MVAEVNRRSLAEGYQVMDGEVGADVGKCEGVEIEAVGKPDDGQGDELDC